MTFAPTGFGGGNYFRAPNMTNLFSPPRQVNYSRAGHRSNANRKKNTFLPLLLIGALLLALSKSRNNPLSNLFGGGNKPSVNNNNSSNNNSSSTNTVAPTGGSGSTTGGGSVTGGGSTSGGGGTTPTTKNAIVDKSDPNYHVITVKNPKDLILQRDTPGDGKIDIPSGGAEIIVNGPITSSAGGRADGLTDGGVIKDGKITQPFIDPATKPNTNFGDNNGIFIRMKNGSYSIMTYDEYDKAYKANPNFIKNIDLAFQNGPILLDKTNEYRGIAGNHNPHDPASTSKKARTGIGVKSNGELVVIYAKSCTFYELGEKMKAAGAVDAMYLDGHTSGETDTSKMWAGYRDDGKTTGDLTDGTNLLYIQT